MSILNRIRWTKETGVQFYTANLVALCWLCLAMPAGAQNTFNLPLGWNYNPDGTLGLRWSGAGTLESAPSLAGPWAAAPGSITYSGSTTQGISGSMGFFRVHSGFRVSPPLPVPTIPVLPPIASATIQHLAALTPSGDTLLEVVFQQATGTGSVSNFFTIDDQVYMLRDDGVYPDTTANDGVFSAIIPLGTNELASWNAHVDEVAATSQLAQPVFTGRNITSTNSLSKFDLLAYSSGIKIPLLPFPCSLGASDFYDWRKTILITNLSVVGDLSRTYDPCVGAPSMGPWSFGYLMSNICNQTVTGIDPVDFTRHWLLNWEYDQTVNFENVPNRSNNIVSQVLNGWATATGGLDLSRAPFRLLAIVNRLDLRSHAFPYDNAGECRFVFGVVDPSSPCSTLPFTVIFEYGVPLKGCAGIKSWANQWAALNGIPFGPAYNAALQAITDQVTAAGSDPSRAPNLSAINQIRSNDLLTFPFWDLREFTLDAMGYLDAHTIKNNPAEAFNGTAVINVYCSDPTHIPKILGDNDTVPLFYLGNPFLGGHALNPPGVWDGSPPKTIADPVRIHFSLNTCNGCHGGETSTGFTHVSQRAFGVPSNLSGFLTGINVTDPVKGVLVSHYADLSRRVGDLDMVVHKPCVCLSLLPTITTPH